MKCNKPSLSLEARLETWPLAEPFRISGHCFERIDVVVATISDGEVDGSGECAGVYYRDETARGLVDQVLGFGPHLRAGADRAALGVMMPAGGARNAIDCAFWDYEAQAASKPVWDLMGAAAPKPIVTTYTCGAETPELMAKTARAHAQASAIKLKLTGEPCDSARVRAVREARPDVWLMVDANQGFSRSHFEMLMPFLVDCKVALIEQPFAVGQEALSKGFDSPIPIAADESVQASSDIARLAEYFQVINIKLDKAGGLSEALRMAKLARDHGLDIMVGNMLGTSLAMAPAHLLAQSARIADLDGPILLKRDREGGCSYADGAIRFPHHLWGVPR